MRLTGSFQTIVTQGVSGTRCSLASVRSTSAGATLTGTSPPRVPSSQSPPPRLLLSPGCPAACPGPRPAGAGAVRSLPFVTDLHPGDPAAGASTALLTD